MDPRILLTALADGEFHSGEGLAAAAGLSRAAIWKNVRKLERWGLEIEAGAGRGYRLSQPIELLDAALLYRSIDRDSRFALDRLDVFTEVDSTNRFVMNNPPQRAGALRICVAEWQSAGRGRLDRDWISPLGSGICMSAGWIYEGAPRDFSAMSLAAGAAIVRAIAAHCDIEIRLKWPNDLVWDSRKLGGVLVESRIESQGRCCVVIGVGLNLALPGRLHRRVSDWREGATDLRSASGGREPGRNALAGSLACELGALFTGFERDGAGGWLGQWRSMDYLHGRSIRVVSETAAFNGVAAGIDADGALLVDTGDAGLRRVVAGDASVRGQ